MKRPTYIFFDVNETLIDIAPLRDAVAERLGGGAGQGRRWFNALVGYSQAETLAGAEHAFADIAAAVLAMLVAEDGGTLSLDEAKALVSDGLGASDAWPDVASGLERLKRAGFTLVALTNSGEDGLEDRLAKVGIARHFDVMLSVQPSGAYKPDRRCYERGLAETGASAERSLMVACHPWDLMGARHAGMDIAFVQRPGCAWYPLERSAAFHVQTIEELADALAQGEMS